MSSQPRTSKRRRSDDEPSDDNGDDDNDGDDDDDDGGPKCRYTTCQATPTKRQTRAFTTTANIGKGKANESRVDLPIVTRPTLDSREGLTRITQREMR